MTGAAAGNSGGVALRLATPHDMPEVQRLYADTGLDDGEPLPLAAALDILRRMESYPSFRLWVAEADGVIVGTYTLLVMDNIPHRGAPSAIVEQVAVAAAAQGAGVGTAMMKHAMQEAAAAGCYKLALTTNLKRHRAHAFYEKLGFERHGLSFLVRIDDMTESLDDGR